jgi:hypothetical protein
MSDAWNRHNVYDLLGVSGPGDAFMSSGPTGQSSADFQQQMADEAATRASAPEPGFFESIFGDEVETAHGGAVNQAVGPGSTEFVEIEGHDEPHPSGGGRGGFGGSSSVIPVSSPGFPEPKSSSTTILAVIAAAVAAFVAFGR